MTRFPTVVIALDFSDRAVNALDAALGLVSSDPAARLLLLRADPDPTPQPWNDET